MIICITLKIFDIFHFLTKLPKLDRVHTQSHQSFFYKAFWRVFQKKEFLGPPLRDRVWPMKALEIMSLTTTGAEIGVKFEHAVELLHGGPRDLKYKWRLFDQISEKKFEHFEVIKTIFFLYWLLCHFHAC